MEEWGKFSSGKNIVYRENTSANSQRNLFLATTKNLTFKIVQWSGLFDHIFPREIKSGRGIINFTLIRNNRSIINRWKPLISQWSFAANSFRKPFSIFIVSISLEIFQFVTGFRSDPTTTFASITVCSPITYPTPFAICSKTRGVFFKLPVSWRRSHECRLVRTRNNQARNDN